MRFYLDEDLSPKIAQAGRRLGLDVVSAHELGRQEMSDEEHLVLAAADGRCVVTVNRDHFIALTTVFFESQRPHAGVLVVPSTWRTGDFSRIARSLLAYSQGRGDAPASYLCDFLR